MGERRTSEVGLLGGSLDEKVRSSRLEPLDLAGVFAPMQRPEDEAALLAHLARRPLHVEIGFGRPHYLCDLARAFPEASVLGFEIKRRWCRDAAKRAAREGLTNVAVIHGDARAYIARYLGDGGVDGYHVLFPDPWWKKRHHKRRLFRPDFVAELHRTLAPGGLLVVKTDVPAYADLVVEELGGPTGFSLGSAAADDPVLATLPRSHREKKCLELGIPVFQFRFTREG